VRLLKEAVDTAIDYIDSCYYAHRQSLACAIQYKLTRVSTQSATRSMAFELYDAALYGTSRIGIVARFSRLSLSEAKTQLLDTFSGEFLDEVKAPEEMFRRPLAFVVCLGHPAIDHDCFTTNRLIDSPISASAVKIRWTIRRDIFQNSSSPARQEQMRTALRAMCTDLNINKMYMLAGGTGIDVATMMLPSFAEPAKVRATRRNLDAMQTQLSACLKAVHSVYEAIEAAILPPAVVRDQCAKLLIGLAPYLRRPPLDALRDARLLDLSPYEAVINHSLIKKCTIQEVEADEKREVEELADSKNAEGEDMESDEDKSSHSDKDDDDGADGDDASRPFVLFSDSFELRASSDKINYMEEEKMPTQTKAELHISRIERRRKRRKLFDDAIARAKASAGVARAAAVTASAAAASAAVAADAAAAAVSAAAGLVACMDADGDISMG